MPRGGKRPGAGAPKGNMNALKDGLRSPTGRALIVTLLAVPQYRRFFLALLRARRYPEAPPCTVQDCPHRVRPIPPAVRKRAIVSHRNLVRVARYLGVEPASLPTALHALAHLPASSTPLSVSERSETRDSRQAYRRDRGVRSPMHAQSNIPAPAESEALHYFPDNQNPPQEPSGAQPPAPAP